MTIQSEWLYFTQQHTAAVAVAAAMLATVGLMLLLAFFRAIWRIVIVLGMLSSIALAGSPMAYGVGPPPWLFLTVGAALGALFGVWRLSALHRSK